MISSYSKANFGYNEIIQECFVWAHLSSHSWSLLYLTGSIQIIRTSFKLITFAALKGSEQPPNERKIPGWQELWYKREGSIPLEHRGIQTFWIRTGEVGGFTFLSQGPFYLLGVPDMLKMPLFQCKLKQKWQVFFEPLVNISLCPSCMGTGSVGGL
jgi:hypothetical protein